MKRYLVRMASVCFVAAILLTVVPLLHDSPDRVTSEPPLYLYSHYSDGDIQQQVTSAPPRCLYLHYPDGDIQHYGLYELAELLRRYRWLSSHYQRGSFDCSEMSAFLEVSLEVGGWHTYIACGPTPFEPDSRHAWLLVETPYGFYVPIEATYPRIVSCSEPYFHGYFKYDHLFETIYDAFNYKPTQFDWWESL